MDVVEKRLTEAVKDHEEYLGDFLGLDIRGADAVLADAPRIRDKFAKMGNDGRCEE